MARIQEYQAQTEVGGPQQTRQAKEADTGNIGDALHGLGQTISKTEEQLQQRAADSEISDLSAKMAERHAQMTQGLDEALAQPGAEDDPDFAKKFMDRYDAQMSDIANNTRSPQASQYMEKANAAMRSQFFVSALHGQAHLAGEQAVQNMNTTVDQLATSVMDNPSGADSAREMMDLAIDHLPSNIPERQRDLIRAQGYSGLAMAEVQGWAKIDPKGTLDRLGKGEWNDDLSSQQKLQLEGFVKMNIHAQDVEAARQEKLKQEAASAQMETENLRLLSKMYNDPQGLSTTDVVGNPKLDFAAQEHLLNMIEHDGGKKFKSDPNIVQHLMNQIHPPDGSPGWTDDSYLTAYFGKPDGLTHPGGLSRDDYDWLKKEIAGKGTQAGADEQALKNDYINKVVRPQLMSKENAVMGIPDPEGGAHFVSWLSSFQPAYEAARRAGKTPHQLLDPQSPDFIGNKVNPSLYLRSPTDIIQSSMQNPAFSSPPSKTPGSSGGAQASAPSSAEPRRPGESAAAYLKRTGN